MKILHVNPYPDKVAGAQKITLNTLKELSSSHQVSVITAKYCGQMNEELEKLNIKVIRLPDILFFETYKFQNNILKAISLFFLNIFVLCIFIFPKDDKKIIYSSDIRGFFSSFFAIFFIRNIFHCHSHMSGFISKLISAFSANIIVPSKEVGQLNFKENNKMNVIYNGLFDNVAKEINLKNNKIYKFLWVGMITPQKGLHSILEPYANIKKNRSSSLTIYGDFYGEDAMAYESYLRKEINRLNIEKNVFFKGWREEIPYKDYDILIFSSIKKGELHLGSYSLNIASSEALPTTIIEAIGNGLRVVAIDNIGVKEILFSKKYGQVIREPFHLNQELIDNIELQSYISKADIIKFREVFSSKEYNNKLNEIFDTYDK